MNLCVGGSEIVRILYDKGPHHEFVVAVLAEELQKRLVAVNAEFVTVIAPVDRHGEADALAQEAKGGFHRHDLVTRSHIGIHTIGSEHLPDLEEILTWTAVQSGDGAVVIGVELVVSFHAVDPQPSIDVLVVVDSLYFGEQDIGTGVRVQVSNEVRA